MTRILALDISGIPFRWLTNQRAIYYMATGKVAWSLGDDAMRFRGGITKDGERSHVDVPPIIALAKSEVMVRYAQSRELPLGDDNTMLFARDLGICAYCGELFADEDLTREHIVPRARGGRDIWTNVVSACAPCNSRKACRTPEEARMPLLYVPYSPCQYEHFILSGRGILVDQMDYLRARLPKHSRLQA